MAVYMIDYENVKTGGLNGISRLTASDRVIIFYSENANRLTFDLHQRLMASPAKIEYREVSVGGHNALDFQLVTYLGYLIAKEPEGQYLIISNDRGFEHVVNFWRKDGLLIGLLPYLKDPSYALQKAGRAEVRAPEAEELSEASEPEELPDAAEAASEPLPDSPIESEPSSEPEEPILSEIAYAAETPILSELSAVPDESTISSEPKATATFADAATQESVPVVILTEETPICEPEEAPSVLHPEEPISDPSAQPAEVVQAERNPAARRHSRPNTQRNRKPKETAPAPAGGSRPAPASPDLRALLKDSVADDPELRFVETALEKYKTKLGLNNALVKTFGNQKAGEIYQKLKPLLTNKKGC